MSKSVLVIDTPTSCSECILCYDCMSCIVTSECFWNKDNFDPYKQTLHNCPLSPLPEMKNLRQYVGNSMLAYQHAQGWNDCIYAILEGDTK